MDLPNIRINYFPLTELALFDNNSSIQKYETLISDVMDMPFIRSQRGFPLLVNNNFVFRCERSTGRRTYWLCTQYKRSKCTGRIILQGNTPIKVTDHCHESELKRIVDSTIEYKNLTNTETEEWLKISNF